VIVSPNTMYAYLSVICSGLRGMQFESNARKIMDDFNRLKGEFDKFEEQFRTLGAHLKHAYDTFGKADRQLNSFGTRLDSIESPDREESDPGKGLLT
ncbi:MAG: DNA recombination protein RmuC, partial [Dehalococcoidia bacterium]|nr:DNA recombination protein RmuC [Dehalococcoidia bacterium]